ncbi:Pro-sigmaK processing inhibitor BofA, partial [Dysosmobacter welbionis]
HLALCPWQGHGKGAAPGHHCPGAGGEPGGEGGADPAPFDGGGGRCVPPRAERSREVGTRPCHPGPVRRGHGPGGPVGLAVSEGPAGPD